MANQGFRGGAQTQPYMYQDNGSGSTSMALGIDGNDSNKIKLITSTSLGVTLDSTPIQMSIDPATNGNMTLSPNGTGTLLVSTSMSTVSGSITAATSLTATNGNITATSGNVVISNGNLTLPATSATVGQITLSGSRFAHAFGGNDFFGINSGNTTLSSAHDNVAIGSSCLTSLTTGAANFAGGSGAGAALADGSFNLNLGYVSGGVLNSGSDNVGLGSFSLASCTTGAQNVGVGYGSLFNVVTGNLNTTLGFNAGFGLTTNDSFNIFIGNVTGTAGDNLKIIIGNGQTSCQISGIFGQTTGVSGIPVVVDNANKLGTVVSSERYKENIRDLEPDESNKIYNLRPVFYNYKKDPAKTPLPGLIAEEVAEVMPQLVSYNQNGSVESVKYLDLITYLVAEVQALKKELVSLKSSIDSKD